MDCPRCGEENDDSRAACWNCLAQLHPPVGAKPRAVETGTSEPAAAIASETEAAPVGMPESKPEDSIPETEPVAEIGEPEPRPGMEVGQEETEAEPESVPIPAEAAAPGPEKEEEADPEDSKVFDLSEAVPDEQVSESPYIVPGLAESQPEDEDETLVVQAPDLPVFDLDTVEEPEAPEPPGESKPEDKA